MKKNYLILLCLPLIITGCGCKAKEPTRSRVAQSSIDLFPNESSSAPQQSIDVSKPLPSSNDDSFAPVSSSIPQPSSSTKPEVDAENLSDEELNKFPLYFLRKLAGYNSYKAVTQGKTSAEILGGLLKVDQTIDVTAIKSEYSYLINESHSDMVNTIHIAYYFGDKAVYKDNDGDYQVSSISDYLDIYGTYPLETAIEGYCVTGESVKSVTRMESEADFKFKVVFDKENATNNVKIQMKKFGELDDYPTFTDDTVMEITVKKDFAPVSLVLTSHYKATKIMESDCTQNYIVTYSSFDETIEIPNLDEVKNKFN